MPQEIDFTVEQPDDTDLVKQLRSQLKTMRSSLTQANKELDGFKTVQRQADITAKFAEKSIAPSYAKFVPADADVDEWIAENEFVHNTAQSPATTSDTESEPEAPAATAATPAAPAAPPVNPAQALQQAGTTATPNPQALIDAVKNAKTDDEYAAAMTAARAVVGWQ